ncbi:MAG: hypothetical protein LBE82_11500 [Chitinophagaceae bacterium]|jgi:cobalamin biosynthesis Mg chelatase CobN|nr:hypothetical protein [Chitinophagaceae bacterium]
MVFQIEHIIKQLEKVKNEGRTSINEKELIKISLPKINYIADVVKMIDEAVSKLKGRNRNGLVTFTNAERLTGITRKTLYEWKKKGIVETQTMILGTPRLNLIALNETMKYIREHQ